MSDNQPCHLSFYPVRLIKRVLKVEVVDSDELSQDQQCFAKVFLPIKL